MADWSISLSDDSPRPRNEEDVLALVRQAVHNYQLDLERLRLTTENLRTLIREALATGFEADELSVGLGLSHEFVVQSAVVD